MSSTAYAWDGTLATTGLGTFGGWAETTTYANYRTAISKQDIFEREVFKQDLDYGDAGITVTGLR